MGYSRIRKKLSWQKRTRHSRRTEGHQQRHRGGKGRAIWEGVLVGEAGMRMRTEIADDCRWSLAQQRFYFSFCRHDGKLPMGV